MMKKAFTIVELLVVISIIGVLMGIITTAASNSATTGRVKRTTALCQLVQTGLSTYNAQKGKWPEPLAGRVQSGNLSQTNKEGPDGTTDTDKYVLSGAEVRQLVKALVDESKLGNPLMDISGLFVSRTSGEEGTKGYGMDFMQAVRGTKQSRKKMSTSEMYFGYPEKNKGYFRRFKIVYSIPTDHVSVLTQD